MSGSGSRWSKRTFGAEEECMLFGLIYLAATSLGTVVALVGRHLVAFVALLVAVLFTQNLLAMLALRYGMTEIAQGDLLLLPKELMLLIAFSYAVALALGRLAASGKVKRSGPEILVVVFLAFLLVQLVMSAVPMYARAAGLRSMALLPLLYLTGRWLPISLTDTARIYKILIGLAIVLALFGLVEAYMLPPTFWLSLGHEEYYLMKVGRPIQDALYNNMRFWVPWSREPIRRIASISGDPLISSYPLAFALSVFGAFVLYVKRVNSKIMLLSLPILVALVLTLSRGAALTLALTLGMLLLFRSTRMFRFGVLLGLVAFVGTVLFFGEDLLRITYGKGHIIELQSGIARGLHHPLGIGLGTAGSVAAGVLNSSAGGAGLAAGGDSYFGSVSTQVGIVGLVLYVVALLSISTALFDSGRRLLRSEPRLAVWYLATGAYIAALLITSSVNESGMGYVASGVVFFFAGCLMSARSRTASRSRHRSDLTYQQIGELQAGQ